MKRQALSGDICNNLQNKYVFLEINKGKDYTIRKKGTTNENIFQINGEYSQEIKLPSSVEIMKIQIKATRIYFTSIELAEIKNNSTKFVGWLISNPSFKMLLKSF